MNTRTYKITAYATNKLRVNKSTEGEPIELKMERAIANNNSEELTRNGAPPIYTERKEGVQPAYNIRTNRWEIAAEASGKIAKSFTTRREEAINKREGKQDGEAGKQNDPGQPPGTETKK